MAYPEPETHVIPASRLDDAVFLAGNATMLGATWSCFYLFAFKFAQICSVWGVGPS